MSETTGATVSVTTRPAELRRHPIRGVLWGLMMGIGLTLVLVISKVIDLDLTMMIVVTVIAMLAGVLWSTVGPAKQPKGPPPATVTASTAPAPTRFDDFTDPAAADEPHRPLEVPGGAAADPVPADTDTDAGDVDVSDDEERRDQD